MEPLDVQLLSWNSRGFNDNKVQFLKEITNPSNSIICIQEHFILRDNSYKILNGFPDMMVFIKPAVKDKLEKGRPKGGLCTAIPNSFKNYVRDISPNNWRIQALKFEFEEDFILINTYLPVDNRIDSQETLEIIASIESIIIDHTPKMVALTGDLNSDFKRSTPHVNSVQSFIENMHLKIIWDHFHVDYTCFNDFNDIWSSSIIDHFLVNDRFYSKINTAFNIIHPSNTSDHTPIVTLASINVNTSSEQVSYPHTSKPSWKKSSPEEKLAFKAILNRRITDMNVENYTSVNCDNVHCNDNLHFSDIDNLTVRFLNTIQDTAEETLYIPTGKKHKKVIPGWTDYVKPFKDNALFWNSIWISCGKPIGTEVHNIMKRTRNKYHFQIRKCKQMADHLCKSKLLAACNDSSKDIFDEIKKIRKCKPTTATIIDGVNEDIENYFGEAYSNLYNSADDQQTTLEAFDDICERVSDGSLHDVQLVTPDLVREAISKLKDDKSDAVFSYTTNCFKYGGESIVNFLTFLIKNMLIHGYVPDLLMVATLVPIIKDKLGDINSSKNYRSIAISNILLKIIDWIFLLISGDKLKLNDLQFAYQENASTTMCSWMVSETINYFLERGSNVYACSMDYSKAFDCVLHGKLFSKLLDKGMSAIFLRLMMFVYINQTAAVRWKGKLSEKFKMTNGVRQGAVTSAILYCFYCEELFIELKRRKQGCWVGQLYMGILGYSDDNFLLLSPSIDGLQDMIRTCEEFAMTHNLQFSTNPDPIKCKTKLILFSKNKVEKPLFKVYLCGNILPWIDSVKHVGNTLSSKGCGLDKDIQIKSAQYINKANCLKQEFSFAHPQTLWKINTIYNFHFTGCELWDFQSESFQKFMSTIQRSFKIMFNLPYETHRYFYEALTDTQHAVLQIKRRFLNFIRMIQQSKKEAPKILLEIIQYDVRSTTGANLRNLMLEQEALIIEDLKIDKRQRMFPVPDDDQWRVGVASEVIDALNGLAVIDEFNFDMSNTILNNLCIN